MNSIDTIEEVIRISGTDPKKCMKCGKCSASCPASNPVTATMAAMGAPAMDILPHRFVKNAEEGNIEALSKSKSLWICLSCFACVERCPRGVEPAHLVEAVRLEIIRKQGANHIKPDMIPGLVELEGAAPGNDMPQQLITSALRKYSK